MARPPFKAERLTLDEDGRVVYALRRRWRDGTSAVVFEPLDFMQNVAGASAWPGSGDPSVSVQGQVVSPGSRHYQVWFRNADPAFCTSATFNLTNGRELTWAP